MATHKDPVCGMQVEETEAAAQAEHEGTTYYFCSPACKDKFEARPYDYLSWQASAAMQ
ncbi:MAG: YHS domain-containing protein [Acidobacteria bacterium]|jgi:P-type Cu+ transporter|nr:YHS domain-containing protein [Acidobacteriota bacterium]